MGRKRIGKISSSVKGTLAAVAAVLCLALIPVATAEDEHGHGKDKPARFLYIWAGDQARVAPDFLAVVNFDEDSDEYGSVIKTVPIPPPGNVGNEPHHCHLSADKKILACGGLLSLLRGQNGIFFFDVSKADDPRFLFSARAPLSSITDDFLPLDKGGFLVTQMGSASGGAPGRVAEFDKHLRLVREWPDNPPLDGFNPHGISARPDLNLMVTSDFINPVSTLNAFPGQELRGSRSGSGTWPAGPSCGRSPSPTAVGTMDVKLIPGDPKGRAYTAGMFDGLVYLGGHGRRQRPAWFSTARTSCLTSTSTSVEG